MARMEPMKGAFPGFPNPYITPPPPPPVGAESYYCTGQPGAGKHAPPPTVGNQDPQRAPKFQKRDVNEFQSLGLPNNFQPDVEHLDTRLIPTSAGGPRLSLLRMVKSEPWSEKIGIAGIPIEQVPLHKVCYRAWEEQGMRTLSHGKEINPVLCIDRIEAIFTAKLLSQIRKSGIDLRTCATEHFWDSLGHAPPNQFAKGSKYFDPMIEKLLECIVSCKWDESQQAESEFQKDVPASESKPAPVSDQDLKIQALEAQMHKLLKSERMPEMSPRKSEGSLPVSDSGTDYGGDSKRRRVEPPASGKAPEVGKSKDEESKKQTPSLPAATAFKPSGAVLEQRSPPSHTPIALKKWIDALETFSPKDPTKPALSDYVKAVEVAFSEIGKDTRPDPKTLAVRWGLPMDLVSKMSANSCLKASAVAAWVAS